MVAGIVFASTKKMPIWRREIVLKFQYNNSTQILQCHQLLILPLLWRNLYHFDLIVYTVTHGLCCYGVFVIVSQCTGSLVDVHFLFFWTLVQKLLLYTLHASDRLCWCLSNFIFFILTSISIRFKICLMLRLCNAFRSIASIFRQLKFKIIVKKLIMRN